MLSPDEITIFPSTLSENLVRIGTVGDGSCFFHSILRGVKQKYREMPIQERTLLAYKIRKELSAKLTIDTYLTLGEGAVASNNFMILLRPRMDLYFKDKIDLKDLDKIVSLTMDNSIEKFKRKFMNEVEKQYPNLHIETDEKFIKLFHEIFHDSYQNYLKYIGVGVFSVSEDIIDYVSNTLELNIYFISNRDINHIYQLGHGKKIYGNRPCVILFCIDNYHYELIGKFYPTMKEGTVRLQTLFESNDPFIQKLQ